MKRRPLGRIHRHDERDAAYRLHAQKSHRNYRYWNGGHVLDQGDNTSCVGEACAEWLDIKWRQFLDPLGIYQLAGRLEAGDKFRIDDGTTVRSGAKVLKLLGFIDRYHWAHTVDDLVYALLEIGPVVLGTNWYADMDEPSNHFDVSVSGQLRGGHSYLADGVDLVENVIRFRQSWGPTYGHKGHAHIRIDEFRRLLAEKGEALVAIERRPSELIPARMAA